ncbi:MAG: endonuclease/exonuclease/phosphatase family protein [Ignavibacteriaceae bacterium]|jgi:endonuclease/exonuclease/phosphatase family metal-dependent hydrolase|nr:endonuclease/exonuclease/phosphatase family protein [Ignavibacteriaceae bacterium]
MKNTSIISAKVFIRCLVIFLTILFLQIPAWAKAEKISVMSRNLYLGAEIQTIAAAKTLEEFLTGTQKALEKAAANDFTERANALAAEIVEKKPHLIGLQEVYNFTKDGINGSPPFRDYLQDLLDALESQGVFYELAAEVKNLDITVPVPGIGSVGVTDSDVILSREDVNTEVVNLQGCRNSIDGCNYSVVASSNSPVGPINFERGFVAVNAMIGTFPVRFFNTHLENRNVDPNNPLSPYIQASQALELITFLNLLPNSQNAPVVVVGDINSSPEHPVIDMGQIKIIPPYKQFEGAGYVDVWTLRNGNPPGFTCCQEENLLNQESILSERVDVIFASEAPINKVKANVVGNDETDKTPSGLWPSDHAGVVAQIEFAP